MLMLMEHMEGVEAKEALNTSLCYMLQLPHCQCVQFKQYLLHIADETFLQSQQLMHTHK